MLYAGGNNWVDHFALGSSTDKGQSWTPLLLFQSIAGLAACPDTDIVKTCGSAWCGETGLVGFFGIQDAGYPCDAGGAGGSGGAGGGSTASPTGCGCGAAGDAAGLLGFLGLMTVWRRKRG